ncbi:type VII secretion protein EccE [Mycobacterium sherrisii]|nr:type VII secretion protein EccE [Mycobacterium sherrisii]MEC4764902.1 type VII secretion protein EccE [Mycobacterium sherrisii]
MPAALRSTGGIVAQRVLPLATLLTAQLMIAAGLAAALLLRKPGWYGALIGLGVTVILGVRFRGLAPARRAVEWLGFHYERLRRKRRAQHYEPFDTELADGSRIGHHWDGKRLTSLLRLVPDPAAMTIMEPATMISAQTVSLRTLADCLRQYDITVDSIDVISQGARLHDRGQVAAVYDAVLGPLPAVAQRTVWVAVRMDPARCPEAVRHRGGGWDGTVRTAATATRRIANRLSDAGIGSHIMTAAEIAETTLELAHGVETAELDESWSACGKDRLQMRSFAVKPAMFTSAGLGALWRVPSDSTTVCVSLRRDTRDDALTLRGLVRFDTSGRARPRPRELGPLPGRQYAALMCGLPVPPPRRAISEWIVAQNADAVDDLELPAAGCGQVIGADEYGRAVALPLFGPRVNRVELCGTLRLAQQVVLRSVALGAWVNVHTLRPAAWQTMVEQIADPNLLCVNEQRADTGRAGSRQLHRVEMLDGTGEQINQDRVTTIIVRPSHAQPRAGADVTLQLLDRDQDLVRVSTPSAAATVTMVATDDEMRYIKSSLDVVD